MSFESKTLWALVLLVTAGCQPSVTMEPEDTAEAATPSPAAAVTPVAPETNWEPQKVDYARSAESLVATEDVIQAAKDGDQPNILVIWGDDIGQSNTVRSRWGSWVTGPPTSIGSHARE